MAGHETWTSASGPCLSCTKVLDVLQEHHKSNQAALDRRFLELHSSLTELRQLMETAARVSPASQDGFIGYQGSNLLQASTGILGSTPSTGLFQDLPNGDDGSILKYAACSPDVHIIHEDDAPMEDGLLGSERVEAVGVHPQPSSPRQSIYNSSARNVDAEVSQNRLSKENSGKEGGNPHHVNFQQSSTFASIQGESSREGLANVGRQIANGDRRHSFVSKHGTHRRLANLLDDEEKEPTCSAQTNENSYRTLGGRSMRQAIDGPFSLFMGGLIILNAFLMFLQLEYDGCAAGRAVGNVASCSLTKESNDWFTAAEHGFNAIFVLELMLRMWVFKSEFFKQGYNLLDGLIVLTTVGRSYIIKPLVESGDVNVSYARLIRLTMMFRAFRVIRVLELFHTLRVLIGTIASSFFCLFWSMIILFILQIVAALLLCQSLQEFILDESGDQNMRLWVNNYYGSSSKALYTMFEFTFSGCWPNYARPIVEEVHSAYAFIFVLYVTAVVFAVTRIITALFLKDTMRIAQQDAEMMVQERMREKLQVVDTLKEIFILADTNGNGSLSFSEFSSLIARPKIGAWLEVLGLDVKDVHTLFHLLDDGDGQIDAEEFVNGMMELKGFAREMDVIQIRHDTRRIMQKCDALREDFQDIRFGPQGASFTEAASPRSAPGPGRRNSPIRQLLSSSSNLLTPGSPQRPWTPSNDAGALQMSVPPETPTKSEAPPIMPHGSGGGGGLRVSGQL